MMPSKGSLVRVGASILLAIAVLFASMYGMQERLLFPGAYGLPDDAAARAHAAELAHATQLNLRSGDHNILAWHYPSEGHRYVLYVGGNYAPIEASAALGTTLNAHGWDVLALAPSGWPGSEGSPGQAAFEQDVLAAWTHLTQSQNIPPDHIVLHGRSIGGGAIGMVLDDIVPAGAVFESTFDSVVPLAQGSYPWLPVRLLLKHPFDTIDRAPHATFPVLQIHGTADTLIPIAQARNLAAAWPNGRLLEVDNLDHNHSALLSDTPFQREWLGWLDNTVPPSVP